MYVRSSAFRREIRRLMNRPSERTGVIRSEAEPRPLLEANADAAELKKSDPIIILFAKWLSPNFDELAHIIPITEV